MMWGPWLIRVSVNACRDRATFRMVETLAWGHEEYQEANYPILSRTPEEMVLSRERRGVFGAPWKLSARRGRFSFFAM